MCMMYVYVCIYIRIRGRNQVGKGERERVGGSGGEGVCGLEWLKRCGAVLMVFEANNIIN